MYERSTPRRQNTFTKSAEVGLVSVTKETLTMKIDWPVGLPEERVASNGQIPGHWVNSNPFANWYQIAPGVWNYHDGVDLNLNTPDWNADWHKPVYAMAAGAVTFSGIGGGSWGNIIVIEH